MLLTGFELQIEDEVSLSTQQTANSKRHTGYSTQETGTGMQVSHPTARYIDEWIVYKTWCEALGVKIIHNLK